MYGLANKTGGVGEIRRRLIIYFQDRYGVLFQHLYDGGESCRSSVQGDNLLLLR